ncbi:MAG: NAD-dependent dehydratase, partial [Glaciihabitans sp.]|nr:NAD-dependent dehydratase [Glaciihabitans sp.]
MAANVPNTLTVLVVGATGSIGRHVVAEAVRQGHTVRALVRSASKARDLDLAAQVMEGQLTD